MTKKVMVKKLEHPSTFLRAALKGFEYKRTEWSNGTNHIFYYSFGVGSKVEVLDFTPMGVSYSATEPFEKAIAGMSAATAEQLPAGTFEKALQRVTDTVATYYFGEEEYKKKLKSK